MSKKTLFLTAVGLIFLMGANAKAVDIILDSPQNGGTVGPGDTVELTLTVKNDQDTADLILVSFCMMIDTGERVITLGRGRPLRLKLEPGETLTKTVAATIPADLPPLPIGPLDITIQAAAKGVKTGTEDSDSVFFTLDI